MGSECVRGLNFVPLPFTIMMLCYIYYVVGLQLIGQHEMTPSFNIGLLISLSKILVYIFLELYSELLSSKDSFNIPESVIIELTNEIRVHPTI